MALSDVLSKPWKKYVAATVGTVLAGVAAKKAVNSVDDYLQLHPPKSHVMQLAAEELSEMRGGLEGLAYGGGEPQPELTKVPGLDYEFDGGVYVWGESNFPKERYSQIAKTFLSTKDKDLHFVFEDNKLYETIGKHIESKYKQDELMFVGFGKDNVDEVGISFKVNGKFYIAFMPVSESTKELLEKYNNP